MNLKKSPGQTGVQASQSVVGSMKVVPSLIFGKISLVQLFLFQDIMYLKIQGLWLQMASLQLFSICWSYLPGGRN